MRKNLSFVVLAAVLLTMVSCNYDDTEIKNQISQLDARLSKVEGQISQMNENISSYLKAVQALESQDRIESVVPLEDGSGYVISFVKAGSITIYNGKNGDKGSDGHTPVIGVKQDDDGTYYWTVNGDYLLDNNNNKIAATAHISVPRVQISEDGKHYEISFDNGQSWITVGDIVSSSNVVTIFKDVEEKEDEVIFYLTEGGTIVIPKTQQFSLNIDNTQIGINAGQTINIGYSVTSADQGTVVDGIASNGYKVVVVGNSAAGSIEITAPDPLVDGKAIIIAVNSRGVTSAKVLTFEEGELALIADATSIGAEGGTIPVMIMTNISYTVNIPESARSWISQVKTKATLRNELLTFQVAANTGAARSATIAIEDSSKKVLQSFKITQEAGSGDPNPGGDSGFHIDDWQYDETISL